MKPRSTSNKHHTKQKSCENIKNNVDKCEKDNAGEKQCSELKETAKKIRKANEGKTTENKIKDAEIDSLNDQIEKVMGNNYDLEIAITKELELRNKYEQEQKQISIYCNTGKDKFKHMQKTISDYENSILCLKEENRKLAEAYDKKIEEIDNDNRKIVKKIDDRINGFNHQKRQILDNEHKIQDLIREVEQQKKVYDERAKVNSFKYNEGEKEYFDLQNKIKDMQMNEMDKGEKMRSAKNVSPRNKEEKKNGNDEKGKEKPINDKFKEYEKNNEDGLLEICEGNKQWKEMSMNSNKVAFDVLSAGDRSMKKSNKSLYRSEKTTARTKSANKI